MRDSLPPCATETNVPMKILVRRPLLVVTAAAGLLASAGCGADDDASTGPTGGSGATGGTTSTTSSTGAAGGSGGSGAAGGTTPCDPGSGTGPYICSVTGPLVAGQPATIAGARFGTHSLDIEWLGGVNGLIESSAADTIPSKNQWFFDSQWADTTIATDQAHSGAHSLRASPDPSVTWNGDFRYDYGQGIPEHTWIMASWWVRRTHAGSGQWKMFRIDPESDITDDVMQSVLFNWDTQHQWIVRFGPELDTDGYQDWDPPFPTSDDHWYRMDYLIYTSAVGVADGIYTLSLLDPQGSETATTTHASWETTYSSALLYRWFLWQNYVGNGITASTIWTDDVYVQVGTQARVELGDAASWETCTHREIQLPTAWSPAGDSITIELNIGAFSSGTAYLYVVDADGNVNSPGYSLSL
jgi:hypothetical protein